MRKTLLAALLATTAVFAAPAMAERVLRLDESAVGEIDPAKGTDYADTVLAINLYESLVYPAQGGPGIEPMLATEWTIDGLDYTFKLRDDAIFSSGNPLTAADVVYSFDRLMAMGQGSASLFEGRVASVEAVDDHTVKFTLSEPFAPFLAALSRLWIVDSKTVAEHYGEGTYGEFGDYAGPWLSQNSAGSGAYMVQSHDPQTETAMARNTHYAGEVDPLAPETVRYRYSLEASTVRALMSRGEHDISSLWLPPEVLKAMADEGTVHLAPEPGGTGEYIKLNTQRPPLDDVHCRRALMHAFDYATMLQLLQVTPELAQGIPMNGAIPSGLIGYDPDKPGFTQDMDAARAELAQCQYDPAQYPLDIAWIADVPARERVALLMQANFTQLGTSAQSRKHSADRPTRSVLIESPAQGRTEHYLPVAVSGFFAVGSVQTLRVAAQDGRQGRVAGGYSSPSLRRLTQEPLPTTTWSWSTMPSAVAACFTSRVISTSALLGVGSPLGWLCTMISAEALSSSARLSTSRG
mgnify:CR=1 FL=1